MRKFHSRSWLSACLLYMSSYGSTRYGSACKMSGFANALSGHGQSVHDKATCTVKSACRLYAGRGVSHVTGAVVVLALCAPTPVAAVFFDLQPLGAAGAWYRSVDCRICWWALTRHTLFHAGCSWHRLVSVAACLQGFGTSTGGTPGGEYHSSSFRLVSKEGCWLNSTCLACCHIVSFHAVRDNTLSSVRYSADHCSSNGQL